MDTLPRAPTARSSSSTIAAPPPLPLSSKTGAPPLTTPPPEPTLGPSLQLVTTASSTSNTEKPLDKLQTQLAKAVLGTTASPVEYDSLFVDDYDYDGVSRAASAVVAVERTTPRRASSAELSSSSTGSSRTTTRRSSTPKTLRRLASTGEASSWTARSTTVPFPSRTGSSGAAHPTAHLEPSHSDRLDGWADSPRWASRVVAATNNVEETPSTPTISIPPSPSSPHAAGKREPTRTERGFAKAAAFVQSLSSGATGATSIRAPPFPMPANITDLPMIAGSPATSPPITRSWSSPPSLPSLSALEPISPIDLTFTPPSASLLPSSTSWPSSLSSSQIYSMPEHTSSAPLLSQPLLLTPSPIESPPVPRLLEPLASVNETWRVDEATTAKKRAESMNEKRYHSFLELVDTEAGYLEHLRTLVKVYFRTLSFLTVLSVNDIRAVVRNAEALLELHERIGARIGEVEKDIDWRGNGLEKGGDPATRVQRAAVRIARIFVDELPNFALYDHFCARHAEAVDIIRLIEHRPEWETFERQCSMNTSVTTSTATTTSSSSGDQTPVATVDPINSPFFFAANATSTPSSPKLSSNANFPFSFIAPGNQPASTAEMSPPGSAARSRLRYADYAITPVQRICRYPLVFGQVLKNLPESIGRDEVKRAWEGLRQVAEGVDAAQRARAGEIRTRIVATRMEFLAPANAAFCDVLGPTLLVGSLHVLHRSHSTDALRVKYLGCFLYRSHLIICKIKKRDSYEPREWLPLRLFDVANVEEGEGALPFSIRLSYRDHSLELGATCLAEKLIWLERLLAAKTEAHRVWSSQEFDASGAPTLFDETLVSSLVTPAASTVPPITQRRSHSRTNSSISIKGVYERATSSATIDEPASPLDAAVSTPSVGSFAAVSLSPTVTSRSRFSSTASALLGKGPTAQHAAIDLRLADVFSEELIQARALAGRVRAISGPRRSLTSQVASRPSKEKRRLSSIDVLGARDFRGAIGYDAEEAVIYAQAATPDHRRWSTSLRKTKSGSGKHTPTVVRPMLPDIDTHLSESSRSSGMWRGNRAVRRASSHSSLQGISTPSPSLSTSSITPTIPVSAFSTAAVVVPSSTADVERQNSVSSSTSGTNSSSSHGVASNTSSAYSAETPPSSIPPSPDYRDCLDLADLHARLPAGTPAPASGAGPGSRWGSHITDNFSNALKIRRRGSTLGLLNVDHHPAEGVERASTDFGSRRGSVTDSTIEDEASTTSLQRRASTASHKIGGFFSKRVQSSPSLVHFFAGASSTSASPRLRSNSTPHLELPDSDEGRSSEHLTAPLSAVSSRSSGSTPPGSGASSPNKVRSSLPPRTSSKNAMTTSRENAGVLGAPSRNRSMRSLFQNQYRLTPMP